MVLLGLDPTKTIDSSCETTQQEANKMKIALLKFPKRAAMQAGRGGGQQP